MIRFACTCSHVLEVPTELAGTSMQCPRCGRLVDIPPLGELGGIDEDGTYKMGADAFREEPDRLAEQFEVFTQHHVDQFGHEKDLRPTEEDFQGLRDPEPMELLDRPSAIHKAPKYDPVTGELIRPLEVARSDPPPAAAQMIPAASAILSYARPDTQDFPARRIIPEMFKLTNLAVMLIILLGHVFQQFVLFVSMGGMWLLVPAAALLTMMFFSHYAIIVEDIGMEGHDDLPRPLRDLNWHDDLWGPFIQLFGSLVICYGSILMILWMPRLAAMAWVATVLLAGTILLPAVFITLTTSGSIINLSPDRLMRVIAALGGSYALAVALWVASLVFYMGGFCGVMLSLWSMFFPPKTLPVYLAPPMWATYPTLVLGVMMMHGFCWYLGLLYRGHHEEFGWAFQRHVKLEPAPMPAPRASSTIPPTLPPPVPPRALEVPPSQQH